VCEPALFAFDSALCGVVPCQLLAYVGKGFDIVNQLPGQIDEVRVTMRARSTVVSLDAVTR
jgi:hypothetical protein